MYEYVEQNTYAQLCFITIITLILSLHCIMFYVLVNVTYMNLVCRIRNILESV